MDKTITALVVTIAFLSGLLASLYLVEAIATTTITGYTTYTTQRIETTGPEPSDGPQKLFNFGKTSEKNSPHDRVKEDQILVYKDKIIIQVKNAEWSTFTDTNSMDPVIDKGSNALEVVPDSSSDIHLGDIVAYESKYSDGTIIHRVIEIGTDEEGWYCKLKGDNNSQADPGKVRFEQIKRVVIGIIY